MPSTQRDYTGEAPHPPAPDYGPSVFEEIRSTVITDEDGDRIIVTDYAHGVTTVTTTSNTDKFKIGPVVVLDKVSRMNLITALSIGGKA